MREKVQVFVLRQLWDFEFYAETADHEKKWKTNPNTAESPVMAYEMWHSGWERTSPWV